MIHLDTNYLIGLLVKGSSQAIEVDGWLAAATEWSQNVARRAVRVQGG